MLYLKFLPKIYKAILRNNSVTWGTKKEQNSTVIQGDPPLKELRVKSCNSVEEQVNNVHTKDELADPSQRFQRQRHVCGYLTAHTKCDGKDSETIHETHRQVFTYDFLVYIILSYMKQQLTVVDVAQFLHVYTPKEKSVFRHLKKDITLSFFFTKLRSAEINAHRQIAGRNNENKEWLPDAPCSPYREVAVLWKNLPPKRKEDVLNLISRVSFALVGHLYPEKEKEIRQYVHVDQVFVKSVGRKSTRRRFVKLMNGATLPASYLGNTTNRNPHRIPDETLRYLRLLRLHQRESRNFISPTILWESLAHSLIVPCSSKHELCFSKRRNNIAV